MNIVNAPIDCAYIKATRGPQMWRRKQDTRDQAAQEEAAIDSEGDAYGEGMCESDQIGLHPLGKG
jgi:hypothetical protein